MGAEIINLAEIRAAQESEKPKLTRKVLREFREHIKHNHPGRAGCVHFLNEQWVLVLTYRPRHKSEEARATVSVYYSDLLSEQDLRIFVTNTKQVKRGRFERMMPEGSEYRFFPGITERGPVADGKEILFPSPEVTREDLLQMIQLARNPLDVRTAAGFSMPGDWLGGKFPLGA